jgi:hypothetical protein
MSFRHAKPLCITIGVLLCDNEWMSITKKETKIKQKNALGGVPWNHKVDPCNAFVLSNRLVLA